MKWEEVKKYSVKKDNRRCVLAREWNENAPAVICIGLNPSTADHSSEDPTTKKLIKILEYNGYGAFAIVNLFECITPDPSLIDEETGCDNTLRKLIATFPDVDIIYMWGAKGDKYEWRIEDIRDICYTREVYCFGKTKSGQPKHPLYLKDNTKIEKYE